MAKQVLQFRYYGENSAENYFPNLPANTDNLTPTRFRTALISRKLFQQCVKGSIIKLGIQGRPGTAFYLNKGLNKIVIGSTGIYELDLEGLGIITEIQFVNDTLDIYNDADNNYRLLIDVLYEGGEST